jgi:hypothetical protein
MCKIATTLDNMSSNAPSFVKSGTIANSSFPANGASFGLDLSLSACSALLVTARTLYPACSATRTVLKPTKPAEPVIW